MVAKSTVTPNMSHINHTRPPPPPLKGPARVVVVGNEPDSLSMTASFPNPFRAVLAALDALAPGCPIFALSLWTR